MAEVWKSPELQESGLSESQTKLTSESASTHGKGQSNVHERTPTECSRSDYPPSRDQEGTEGQDGSKELNPEFSEKNGVDQTPEYPSSWKLTMIMTGLCLSIFCMALDNTIMATAIPKITDQFNSLSDVGWYGSAYLLTTCSLTLMFGKFYTFYSTKWVFLIGLTIFEIGSFICGIAPSSVALIIGRAVAGCGAAGLFSGAMLIVYRTVPLQKRPIYSGLLGGIFGVASVAGPLMGGAFTDHLSWRWCFYINLPFGAVTWLFIFFFFKAPRSIKETTGIKDQISQLDLPGTLFFMPAIICMLLALQWGGTKYAWNSARIIALFVVFGLLIAGFIALQWYGQDKATVPPRIIKNRNVWGAGFFNFCLGAAFLVFCYFLPIWFQAIKGVTATKSGIMNLPLILGCVTCSFISGTFVSVLGYYTPFMLMSPVVMAMGGGLLSTLKVNSGHAAWIGYQALLGIGLGVGMQQPMMVVQTALPAADVPSATAIVMFTQTLGGALFVSVGENVFQNQLYKNLAIDVPNVNSTELVSAGATMLRHVVSEGDLPKVLHAYNAAITEAFYVPIAIGALAILGALPVQWISVRGKNVEMLAG